MRIVYFGNNRNGLNILRWLKEMREEVVGLVIHPDEKGRYVSDIVRTAELGKDRIWPAPSLKETRTIAGLRELRPDVGISINFGYRLQPAVIGLFPLGCLNLHTGYLPYNRGAHPNVWSLVEGTPAGVTLHYMDEGMDTGGIIAKERVEAAWTDTGASLYGKLEAASLSLFQKTWPRIRRGERLPSTPQQRGEGTFHRARDLQTLDPIDLDKHYRARDLINLLRARTFAPYSGAYFEEKGEKIYIRISLLREEEMRRERGLH
ncbi:MAG: hypothetical protein HYU99_03240 [Deltaproteobacteria bacterium]|nr:hypothetical protein [Deltaproteobacteria bacterium]